VEFPKGCSATPAFFVSGQSVCNALKKSISIIRRIAMIYQATERTSNHDYRLRDRSRQPEFCTVTPAHSWYLPWKRVADFILSLVLLMLLGPVICLAALLIKLTSRGSAFYRQVRVGTNARAFAMIKLRTMVDNAEAQTGPVWSTGNDSRTTPLGRLLRQTHIDEFPQLFNVLFGQMSLVGPRPERPEFVAGLEREVPGYRQRLDVQPGITGLAQLRLPPDTDIESVRRKIVFDLHYVQWVSPWLDLHLLVLTAWSLVGDLCRCARTCVKWPIRERRQYGVQ
jgi:lipopolysaccharide/colanic/teichoic acid biosynthesis glycosyltransferase